MKGRNTIWANVPEPCRWDPDVILTALRLSWSGETQKIGWDDIPTDLQRNHREIALRGVRQFNVDADTCPCLLDRSFMKKQFLDHGFLWQQLPTELKNDIEFARSMEQFPTAFHVHQIFDNFPALCADRAVWVKAVNAVEVGQLSTAIRDYAPAEIRSDRELMEKACTRQAEILLLVDNHLADDRGFLLAIAGRNAFILWHLTKARQLRFPDVVDRALQQTAERFTQYELSLSKVVGLVHVYLARELWNNREFVLRWFQLGLPFVNFGPFRETAWKEDKEIFLLVARHCRSDLHRVSFGNASMKLRRDKKFMLQILEIAPSLLEMVVPELRNDFDLCLLAFSGYQSAVRTEVDRRLERMQERNHPDRTEYDYLDEFRSEVSEHLNAHTIFSTIVLPAISQTPDSGCALTVLNQGAETSRSYKKRVAEYLDVPTGKRLRLRRQADRNLNNVLDGRGGAVSGADNE